MTAFLQVASRCRSTSLLGSFSEPITASSGAVSTHKPAPARRRPPRQSRPAGLCAGVQPRRRSAKLQAGWARSPVKRRPTQLFLAITEAWESSCAPREGARRGARPSHVERRLAAALVPRHLASGCRMPPESGVAPAPIRAQRPLCARIGRRSHRHAHAGYTLHLVNQDRGLRGLVSRSRPGGRRRHYTPYGLEGRRTALPHSPPPPVPGSSARTAAGLQALPRPSEAIGSAGYLPHRARLGSGARPACAMSCVWEVRSRGF